MEPSKWTRRDALRAAGGVATATIAGCGGLLERQAVSEPPVLDDRPDAVYVPTHVEGMEMIGMTEAGDRMVALMYSYAHRFWTMEGGETVRTDPGDDDVHLMATVWDPDTGTVLPVASGTSFEITQEGDRVASRSPWPMLSQNMGFHFGDNLSLDGDGTYTVAVDLTGLSVDRVGAFADRFGDPATAEFEWEYSEAARNEITFRELDDAGDAGAVDPMEMEMPLSFAPAEADLPGRVLGSATSGDAVFVATVLSGDDGDRLAVSPRTPYNRYVVPMMSLSATIARDGEAIFDDVLRTTLGPDLGYHYAAPVEGVESGDEVTITVDGPSIASRHEGYETAFLEMPDVTFSVE